MRGREEEEEAEAAEEDAPPSFPPPRRLAATEPPPPRPPPAVILELAPPPVAGVTEAARSARWLVRAPPPGLAGVTVATSWKAQGSRLTRLTLCTPTAQRTAPTWPAPSEGRGKTGRLRGSTAESPLAETRRATALPPTEACAGRGAVQSGMSSECTAASAWKASKAQKWARTMSSAASMSTTGHCATDAIKTGSPPSRVSRRERDGGS